MPKKRPKTWTWVYRPPKPPVPDDLQAEVGRKAEAVVQEFLKPQFIKPPPKDWRWNYIIDILGGRRTWGLSTFGVLTCSTRPWRLVSTSPP